MRNFGWALTYAKLLLVSETWVFHFTFEDNATKNLHWPIDRELKKAFESYVGM